jgi:glucose-1-phosphate thymidylyltransferase
MKVLIPVAGIGSKLRPHTHTQPKTLVPIAGKPILAHIIDNFYAHGFDEFVFVLGYLGDKIESYIKQNYPELKTIFVTQEPREGLAHAIWTAREHLDPEEPLMIVLGDTIATFNMQAMRNSPNTVVAVQKVETPEQFGIVETDAHGYVTKMTEKPLIPKSNLALVGVYKIKHVGKLLTAIEYIIQNNLRSNNEYHLTDALAYLLAQGENIAITMVDNWFDCGKKETLLEANAILLNNPTFKVPPKDYLGTIIVPPVSIGQGCRIEHSIIGPNVAIGDNTTLRRSIVQNSIIGSYSELEDVVLKASVIGNDSSLKGMIQSLNIGDNTEINFGK